MQQRNRETVVDSIARTLSVVVSPRRHWDSRQMLLTVLGTAFILVTISGCGIGQTDGGGGNDADGSEPSSASQDEQSSSEALLGVEVRMAPVESEPGYREQVAAALYSLALEDAGAEVSYVDRASDFTGNNALGEVSGEEDGLIDLYPLVASDSTSGETTEEGGVALEVAENAPLERAVVMEPQVSRDEDVSDVSDLAQNPELRIAASGDPFSGADEALERFWFEAAGEGEGGERDVLVGEESNSALEPMQEGEAEAALTTNDTPEVSAQNLVILEDREDLLEEQTSYLVPVIREDIVSELPEVERVLNDLSAQIEIGDLRTMFARMEYEGESAGEVAESYYEQEIR